MLKRLFALLSVLVFASLLIAACGSASMCDNQYGGADFCTPEAEPTTMPQVVVPTEVTRGNPVLVSTLTVVNSTYEQITLVGFTIDGATVKGSDGIEVSVPLSGVYVDGYLLLARPGWVEIWSNQ